MNEDRLIKALEELTEGNLLLAKAMRDLRMGIEGGAVEVGLATGPVLKVQDYSWDYEEEMAYRMRHAS